MAKAIPLWTQAGLPGRPVVVTADGFEDIAPGRVIRGRDGKALYFDNEQIARWTAEMATEFLGKGIERVFFMRKNGEHQRQYALSLSKDAVLARGDTAAIEALAWLRAREMGKVKRKKLVRVAAGA